MPETIKKQQVSILKVDAEKRIIKTAVYVPNLIDTQGDWATAEDIEAAAHSFMKELKLQNVDTFHDFQKVDAFVCESYISKGDSDWEDGSWVVCIKIDSDEVWAMVLKGEIEGVSMAGTALRYEGVEPPAEIAT